MTSLFDATRLQSIDQVRLLIYSGQNVNTKDWSGDTPLLVAARDGMMGIVKVLLIMGADVNAFNQSGDTSLHESILYGHIEVALHLLEQPGVDISIKNDIGDTPLHRACRNGHAEIVAKLIDMGANIYARNKEGLIRGKSPADLASTRDVKTLLMKRMQKDYQIRG